MSTLERLRQHPAFAAWLAQVHPLFWPVFLWQMTRAARWLHENGITDALVRVRWWGKVEIIFPGDRAPDPSAYRPLPPQRSPWSDPVWASDLPANLPAETQRPVFPRDNGASVRTQSVLSKGASALTAYADTS